MFRVSFPFTFRRMLLSSELDLKVRMPWLFRILRIVLAVMGVWLLVEFFTGRGGSRELAVAVLALVVAVFAKYVSAGINFLSLGRLRGDAQAKCVFHERMIVAENMRIPVREVGYDMIVRMVEYRGCYFLITSKIGRSGCMYLLPKDCFVSGDPAEFPAFIEEKTGKPVEYIK